MPERQRRARTQSASTVLHGTMLSRLLALPALLLLGLTAWHIIPMGLASAWYFKANYFVELWVKNQPLLTEESWKQASEAIDKAIELHPKHPHYLLTKAKINEWGWYGDLMTRKELEDTEKYYLDAIHARHTWPNAHADYAYYLGVTQFRITEAFEQLDLAKKYGPYIPETMLRTLSVGLFRWSNLNAMQKANTLAALKNATQARYPIYKEALRMVKETKKNDVVCIYLSGSKRDFSLEMQKRLRKDFCTSKNGLNNTVLR
jgi:tetratricopeptide (TPR) repeat protein